MEASVIKRIINVEETEGKFGPKLDAWFEDGSRLSLSGKNVGELMRMYGTNSDLWLDKNVQLTVGEYETRDGWRPAEQGQSAEYGQLLMRSRMAIKGFQGKLKLTKDGEKTYRIRSNTVDKEF